MPELDTTPDRCPCGILGPHSGCSWWRAEVTPDTDQDRSWQVLAAQWTKRDRLHAALERWVEAKDAWAALTKEDTSIECIRRVDEVVASTQALEALAREVRRG